MKITGWEFSKLSFKLHWVPNNFTLQQKVIIGRGESVPMGIVNKHNYKLKLSHKLNHSLLFPRQYSSTPASVKLLLHDVVSQTVQLLTEKRVLRYQLCGRSFTEAGVLLYLKWLLPSWLLRKRKREFSDYNFEIGKPYGHLHWMLGSSFALKETAAFSLNCRKMLFPRQYSCSEKPLPQNVAMCHWACNFRVYTTSSSGDMDRIPGFILLFQQSFELLPVH